MYHRGILRLNMKTELILVCLFSLFSRAREAKGTQPVDISVIFYGDGKIE